MKKRTWHIHIEGQVQGVGFRPFVYKTAKIFRLCGWVNNTIDGVHASFNADEKTAHQFYQSLIEGAPSLSRITSHEMQRVASKYYSDFNIIHSDAEGEANLLLTPDFAMCNNCRKELLANDNRRSGYPFITCTNCGPRYSIIKKLPYDRETTTMASFKMCTLCRGEYEDPLDRRYYSQTNSCADCGISLYLYDKNQKLLCSDTRQIIPEIVRLWTVGNIIALKGIGGYLLTCDAHQTNAIEALRARKLRPTKPLALMYPNLHQLEQDVVLSTPEKQLLTNAVSPILLLQLKNKSTDFFLEGIAPGLDRIGIMLPYTPFYELLMQEFAHPVVATSGNISNSPIIFSNQKALKELTRIADYVLTNDRDIAVPQDDSVALFSTKYQQQIIIRRSRGLAPTYINKELEFPKTTILATGGLLKSTFSYLHQQNVYISQYLGDLDHFDTQKNYRHMVEHFLKLFGQSPAVVLADKHPGYFSTTFAEQLSREQHLPLKKYQHHTAHFAAVIGEHNLVDTREPVLGVVWDGIGLGDDGQIWGGEFFLYHNYTFQRQCHFDYFDFILGDKMSREPRISALAAARGIDEARVLLKRKFSDLEWKNYRTLLRKKNKLQTSSVGRLFDAVASLLDIKDFSSFEGEAAMLLESLADKTLLKDGQRKAVYLSNFKAGNIPTKKLIQQIIDDIHKGTPKEIIAAKFHLSLVHLIAQIARHHVRNIAFSGGVFQNSLLVDLIIHGLQNDFNLYFHQDLSPNDENISFGQLMCYHIKHRKDTSPLSKETSVSQKS